jgi:hypothetical protein
MSTSLAGASLGNNEHPAIAPRQPQMKRLRDCIVEPPKKR